MRDWLARAIIRGPPIVLETLPRKKSSRNNVEVSKKKKEGGIYRDIEKERHKK